MVSKMNDWNYESNTLIDKLGGTIINDKMVTIERASTSNAPQNNSIIFFSNKKWKEEYMEKLTSVKRSFIIIEPGLSRKFSDVAENNCVVEAENARLYFAKALKCIIESVNVRREYRTYGVNAVIGENVHIGENCSIEPFVFLDHDVFIGNNVKIKSGAKIRQNVIIEDNVVIGENSVIGAQGFGIESDEEAGNIRIPHIGGVIIKENSEIGALTSIVAGTIQPTLIECNVFIDDLNHIAHNCKIGKRTLSTAAVQISGSAQIGEDSYIAPNATIKNGISIGQRCFIGQASSVQHSYEDNQFIVGNPARNIRKKEVL